MKKCTWCGKEYPDDAVVCALDQMELKSDQPEPSADSDNCSAAKPDPADEGLDVPEGYIQLGSFDPFDAAGLLRRYKQDGIRFLIDRVETSVVAVRGLSKRSLIQICVHNDDFERASKILAEDWKV